MTEKEQDIKANWNCISATIKLTEDFIRKYKDEVNWWHITRHQELSEDFIEEFKDKIDWDYISNKYLIIKN